MSWTKTSYELEVKDVSVYSDRKQLVVNILDERRDIVGNANVGIYPDRDTMDDWEGPVDDGPYFHHDSGDEVMYVGLIRNFREDPRVTMMLLGWIRDQGLPVYADFINDKLKDLAENRADPYLSKQASDFEVRKAEPGEIMYDYKGMTYPFQESGFWQQRPDDVAYNLYDGAQLIGSIWFALPDNEYFPQGEDQEAIHVFQAWVDPEYRNTDAFMKLMQPVMAYGYPIQAAPQNPKLKRVMDRLIDRGTDVPFHLAALTGAVHDNLVEQVRDNLSEDLLKPGYGGEHPMQGHCYTATEALYHLLGGKESGYHPVRLRLPDGITHWWLENDLGEVIDATHDQFGGESVPYDEGRAGGFLTAEPSKRAQELMRRVTGKTAADTIRVEEAGPDTQVYDYLGNKYFPQMETGRDEFKTFNAYDASTKTAFSPGLLVGSILVSRYYPFFAPETGMATIEEVFVLPEYRNTSAFLKLIGAVKPIIQQWRADGAIWKAPDFQNPELESLYDRSYERLLNGKTAISLPKALAPAAVGLGLLVPGVQPADAAPQAPAITQQIQHSDKCVLRPEDHQVLFERSRRVPELEAKIPTGIEVYVTDNIKTNYAAPWAKQIFLMPSVCDQLMSKPSTDFMWAYSAYALYHEWWHDAFNEYDEENTDTGAITILRSMLRKYWGLSEEEAQAIYDVIAPHLYYNIHYDPNNHDPLLGEQPDTWGTPAPDVADWQQVGKTAQFYDAQGQEIERGDTLVFVKEDPNPDPTVNQYGVQKVLDVNPETNVMTLKWHDGHRDEWLSNEADNFIKVAILS
jgi:hypothetical protein